MKLKQEPQDFRVRELIGDSFFKDRGRFQVYRVTKKKLTSLEAAGRLADLAGVAQSEVAMAGLKDRQGVTVQFMTVKGGRPVFLKTPELRIETAGFASREITSSDSEGNAFEITVRKMSDEEREALVKGAAEVKAYGLPNYFGEQRFGNLRHGQGWIARDLALGKHEVALRALIAGKSEHDDARNSRFKRSIEGAWGDWRSCREFAGRFGNYISVFQHLIKHEDDFAGAFRFVKSQLRLIHLYAWQSHVWNRAVAAHVESVTRPEERFMVAAPEGRLIFARGELKSDPKWKGMFRLPGPGLDDVKHPAQRDLLALALRQEGLQPHEFRIEGVSGFQLKGEDRPLLVTPRNLRIDTPANGQTIVSFELPRGSYATLVMSRLVPPEARRPAPYRDHPDGGQRGGPRGAPRGASRSGTRGGERAAPPDRPPRKPKRPPPGGNRSRKN
ncbi:MAG: tRNA pseudouridine(13) synthase TruD [Planctomycetes bacterium]|nr:tRNA pseudouridine(13) synthase TruD [Planctomycetota bacterium]